MVTRGSCQNLIDNILRIPKVSIHCCLFVLSNIVYLLFVWVCFHSCRYSLSIEISCYHQIFYSFHLIGYTLKLIIEPFCMFRGFTNSHYVKSVHIWSSSGPYFPVFGLTKPYLVRMLENTDQKNSEYGHFTCCVNPNVDAKALTNTRKSLLLVSIQIGILLRYHLFSTCIKIFKKTLTFLTRTPVYQGVRNVSFSETLRPY